MPTDVRIFSGRMNDDDHATIVPQVDYRYAKNVHINHSADGGVLSIKNVPGTTEVSYTLAGTSGLQVVGSIEDEQYNRVFYFVKATVGSDEIVCYNRTTGEIGRVLYDGNFASEDGQDASMDLDSDYLITGIAFIYPWLFWTDDNNHPRRVNVERGLRTNDNTYVSPDGTAPVAYTTPLTYKDITIIREPPRFPIETRKLLSTDEADVPDQETNQIVLFSFQFAYRFLYKDGSLSVLSPYSKLVPFNTDSSPNDFDTVEVKIPKSQYIPNEVDELQILVRDPQTNSWGIIKRYRRVTDAAAITAHNTLGGTALTYYFYNTYASTLIDEAEGLKAYDVVPIRSKALEVGKNRIFLGNNLEGYDPLDELDITVSRVVNETGTPSGTTSYIYVYTDTEGFDPDHYAVIVVLLQTGDPTIDGYYEYQETDTYDDFSNGNLPLEVFLSQYDKIGDIGDFDPFHTGLIGFYTLLWGVDPPGGPGPGPGAFVDDSYTGTQPIVYGLGNEANLVHGDLIFKSGSRYQVGIVFYDWAGRNNGVYTNEDCLIHIPERLYTATEYTTGLTWLIDSGADSSIPDWATYYSIVRTKNLTTDFFFMSGAINRAYVTIDDDGTYVYTEGPYPTNSDLYAIAWETFLDKEGAGYTYAEGDIMKFWYTDDSEPETFAIIGTDGRFILTKPKDVGDLTAAPGGRIEIYTPIRSSENPIFYEVGEVYPIVDAGTNDKAFSVYTGVLRGDVYFEEGIDGDGTALGFERMSPNKDVWQQWNTDAGRPNIVLLDSKQERRSSSIRWGNQYVAGAKINGLCSFDAVDEKVLEESGGPIQKLIIAGKSQAEGNVMLSIGTNETFSIYLGETQVVDNSEQTLLATSGNVLGTTRDLRGGFGTNHPESVQENDGRIYWYDEQRGAVVRYANGLSPISDYKFRAFFNRLSGQTPSNPVISGFDRLRSEYLITFTGLEHDADVEFLNDYSGSDRIRGSLTDTRVPIGTSTILYAGVSYEFEVEFDVPGELNVYVGGTNVHTEYFTDSPYTKTFTITPTQTGIFGYTFIARIGPASGTYTITESLVSPHQAWNGEDFTIGFRDIDGREGWASFYDFVPEWMSKSGNLLLSFKNGKLYRHDNELAYNTFYGTQYNSGIAFVVNQPVPTVKWAAAIGVQANYAPSWVHVRTERPYVQSSDLEDEDFRMREGFHYAEIRRDRLSPNASGSNYFEKSLNGDKMRSSLLEIYAEFSIFEEELNIDLIKIMWQPSSGHF